MKTNYETLGIEYFPDRIRKYVCKTCGRSYKRTGPEMEVHHNTHLLEAQKPVAADKTEGGETNMAIIDLRENFGKQVTPEEFTQMKQMLADGVTSEEIVRTMRRSTATLSSIRNSNTFEEFKQYVHDKSKKKNQPKRHMYITQEDFDEVKQAGFTGENYTTIAEKLHRSPNTVRFILESQTLAEYKEKARMKIAQYAGKEYVPKAQTPLRILPPATPITDRYGKVKEFREKLDEVLMEFILGEVQAKNAELKHENTTLKKENEYLKQRLEELEQPDFAKKLQSQLNNIE